MCVFTRVRHALPEPSQWRRAGCAAGASRAPPRPHAPPRSFPTSATASSTLPAGGSGRRPETSSSSLGRAPRRHLPASPRVRRARPVRPLAGTITSTAGQIPTSPSRRRPSRPTSPSSWPRRGDSSEDLRGESGHGDTRPRPYPPEASRFTRSECWSHAALLDSSPCPSPYLPFALPFRTEQKMLFP